MTNHAMVIGGIALAGLSAWALVHFLHWRSDFRG